MARRSSGNTGCGCLVVGFLLIVAVGALGGVTDQMNQSEKEFFWIVTGSLIFLLVLGGLIKWARTPAPKTHCELCRSPFGEKAYDVTVQGKALTVCGNCGAAIKAKMSRQAVNALFEQMESGQQPPPTPPT